MVSAAVMERTAADIGIDTPAQEGISFPDRSLNQAFDGSVSADRDHCSRSDLVAHRHVVNFTCRGILVVSDSNHRGPVEDHAVDMPVNTRLVRTINSRIILVRFLPLVFQNIPQNVLRLRVIGFSRALKHPPDVVVSRQDVQVIRHSVGLIVVSLPDRGLVDGNVNDPLMLLDDRCVFKITVIILSVWSILADIIMARFMRDRPVQTDLEVYMFIHARTKQAALLIFRGDRIPKGIERCALVMRIIRFARAINRMVIDVVRLFIHVIRYIRPADEFIQAGFVLGIGISVFTLGQVRQDNALVIITGQGRRRHILACRIFTAVQVKTDNGTAIPNRIQFDHRLLEPFCPQRVGISIDLVIASVRPAPESLTFQPRQGDGIACLGSYLRRLIRPVIPVKIDLDILFICPNSLQCYIFGGNIEFVSCLIISFVRVSVCRPAQEELISVCTFIFHKFHRCTGIISHRRGKCPTGTAVGIKADCIFSFPDGIQDGILPRRRIRFIRSIEIGRIRR